MDSDVMPAIVVLRFMDSGVMTTLVFFCGMDPEQAENLVDFVPS
jgi:hypothetical protein